MSKSNSVIFLIVGASGSGKTAICSWLEQNTSLTQIQSYTTRPPRSERENGHVFVSNKDFLSVDDRDVVAYTFYNNCHYWATTQQLEDNDLYVIDPAGVEYLIHQYSGAKKIRIVYIDSPIHTRVQRMEDRGDSFPMIMERIVNDVVDFKDFAMHADYIVHNSDDRSLEDVSIELLQYIQKTGGEKV